VYPPIYCWSLRCRIEVTSSQPQLMRRRRSTADPLVGAAALLPSNPSILSSARGLGIIRSLASCPRSSCNMSTPFPKEGSNKVHSSYHCRVILVGNSLSSFGENACPKNSQGITNGHLGRLGFSYRQSLGKIPPKLATKSVVDYTPLLSIFIYNGVSATRSSKLPRDFKAIGYGIGALGCGLELQPRIAARRLLSELDKFIILLSFKALYHRLQSFSLQKSISPSERTDAGKLGLAGFS
jgi:hypothetical protein